MNQTLENSKKPNFGPDFGYFGSNASPKKFFLSFTSTRCYHVTHCCMLSLYAISRKTNEPNLEKWQKNLVSGVIVARLFQIQASNFFFKNLASSVTRYHGQLSSCAISEKNYDPILRKFSDGWADGQTDESDFIGRHPNNVERPK